MTHAFFKACLFLGSGSVIHGCGGEQDMRKMGGLKKFMPRTHWTMLVATIAIAGIPPLAGFFSKDEILAGAFGESKLIWIIGVIAAGFTAFYMFRLYFMTFHGEYRGAHVVGIEESEPKHAGHDLIPAQPHLGQGDAHAAKAHGHHAHAHDPHESPLSMTGVLAILAGLSVIGGWVGIPAALGGSFPTLFQRWLAPILLPIEGHAYHFHEASHMLEWALMAISVAVAASGIFLAWRFYLKDRNWSTPKRLAGRFAGVHQMLVNKYYVDEAYGATAIGGTVKLSRAMWWFDANVIDGLVNGTRNFTVSLLASGSALFDRFVIDGTVNGVAWSAGRGSNLVRRVQSGLVQNYALIMGAGILLMAVVYLFVKP